MKANLVKRKEKRAQIYSSRNKESTLKVKKSTQIKPREVKFSQEKKKLVKQGQNCQAKLNLDKQKNKNKN